MFNFTIDYPKTRKAVENFVWNYENMKYKLDESKTLGISASFIMVNPNKQVNRKSSIENSVIYSIEIEEKLMNLLELIEKSFNRLSTEERQYLGLRYFSNLILNDEEIRDKMRCGYRNFTDIKRKAIIRFALALGIEVYVDVKKIKK